MAELDFLQPPVIAVTGRRRRRREQWWIRQASVRYRYTAKRTPAVRRVQFPSTVRQLFKVARSPARHATPPRLLNGTAYAYPVDDPVGSTTRSQSKVLVTTIRFDSRSTALRLFDDLRYDRTTCLCAG